MANYKKMYYKLFNGITDSIAILQKAQQETEEIYINSQEPAIILINSDDESVDEDENNKKPPL